MKRSAAAVLIICLSLMPVTLVISDDALTSRAIFVKWDHWLWMERIAKQDPRHEPEGGVEGERQIRMYSRRSAKELYEACGIEIHKGESFHYGATTSQMIVRLSPETFRQVGLIHQTMDAWRKGHFEEWRHGEVKEREQE